MLFRWDVLDAQSVAIELGRSEASVWSFSSGAASSNQHYERGRVIACICVCVCVYVCVGAVTMRIK